MAKFCGHCGAQLNDDARVCGYCGTPLGGPVYQAPAQPQAPAVNYAPRPPMDPAKKAKIKKVTILSASLVAAAAVIVVGIIILTGFLGTNGATRKIMNAYKSSDVDTLVEMTSPTVSKVFNTQYGVSGGEEQLEKRYQNVFDTSDYYFEQEFGYDYQNHMSWKIVKTTELNERKIANIVNAINTYYYLHLDESDISKMVVVDVELTIKDGEKSRTYNVKLYLTQEDGQWMLFDAAINNSAVLLYSNIYSSTY